jgi:hypothetical protein
MSFPAFITFITIGGLITHVKSAWELSRLVRKKIHIDARVEEINKDLTRAFRSGYISKRKYDQFQRNLEYVKSEGCTYSWSI